MQRLPRARAGRCRARRARARGRRRTAARPRGRPRGTTSSSASSKPARPASPRGRGPPLPPLGATRSSITLSAAPRASRGGPHRTGPRSSRTASRRPRPSSWRASVRLASTTLSMSGASSSASLAPRGGHQPQRGGDRVVAARRPPIPGSTRSSSNQPMSSSLHTSTGARVVGDDPGRADLGTDQLHQRRLPGARRAADHHQHRRVDRSQPRDQVVVDLARQLLPARGGAPRAGRRQGGARASVSRSAARASGSAEAVAGAVTGRSFRNAASGGHRGRGGAGTLPSRLVESARCRPRRPTGASSTSRPTRSPTAASGSTATRRSPWPRARRAGCGHPRRRRRVHAPGRRPRGRRGGADPGRARRNRPGRRRRGPGLGRHHEGGGRGPGRSRAGRDVRQRRDRAAPRPGDGGPRRRRRVRRVSHAHARRAAHGSGTRATATSSTTSAPSWPSGSRTPSPPGSTPACIQVDPGLGFGKTLEHNLESRAASDEIAGLGFSWGPRASRSWAGSRGARTPTTASPRRSRRRSSASSEGPACSGSTTSPRPPMRSRWRRPMSSPRRARRRARGRVRRRRRRGRSADRGHDRGHRALAQHHHGVSAAEREVGQRLVLDLRSKVGEAGRDGDRPRRAHRRLRALRRARVALVAALLPDRSSGSARPSPTSSRTSRRGGLGQGDEARARSRCPWSPSRSRCG